MRQLKTKIIKSERIAPQFYKMTLKAPYLAKTAKPGQFVEARCSDGTDPLLRRPLSVHRVTKSGIELLYEVAGKGTELLSKMKAGGSLDVIGPLGHGFDIPAGKGEAIIVAGGNGVAPLLFLAEKLIARKTMPHVLIGGCSKTHILCEKEFKRSGAKVSVATEDGSKGHKGLATELLKAFLRNTHYALLDKQIYACGPMGMLKAVSEIAHKNRVLCQVSLEERMACGVGVCLGCPVKTVSGYKMVCEDGPVFNSDKILWE